MIFYFNSLTLSIFLFQRTSAKPLRLACRTPRVRSNTGQETLVEIYKHASVEQSLGSWHDSYKS